MGCRVIKGVVHGHLFQQRSFTRNGKSQDFAVAERIHFEEGIRHLDGKIRGISLIRRNDQLVTVFAFAYLQPNHPIPAGTSRISVYLIRPFQYLAQMNLDRSGDRRVQGQPHRPEGRTSKIYEHMILRRFDELNGLYDGDHRIVMRLKSIVAEISGHETLYFRPGADIIHTQPGPNFPEVLHVGLKRRTCVFDPHRSWLAAPRSSGIRFSRIPHIRRIC